MHKMFRTPYKSSIISNRYSASRKYINGTNETGKSACVQRSCIVPISASIVCSKRIFHIPQEEETGSYRCGRIDHSDIINISRSNGCTCEIQQWIYNGPGCTGVRSFYELVKRADPYVVSG